MDLSKVNDLRAVNRKNSPDYGQPIEVLGATTQHYDLDFVKAITSDTESKPNFNRPLPSSELSLPAINLREVDNVYVADSFVTFDEKYVYTDSTLRGGLEKIDGDRALAWSKNKISKTINNISFEHKDESVLVVHNEGGATWGHHVIQNFPKILFISKFFPHMKIALPEMLCRLSTSHGKLLDAYNVDRNSIIPLKNGVTYFFKSVFILDFLFDNKPAFIHPWALQALRSIVEKPEQQPSASKLFIKRELKRAIENQTETELTLESNGYEVFSQTHKNLECQIAKWGNAKSVVATLGSDMTNIVFLPRNASVLSLSPDWFGDRFFYNLACATQINWYELRCGKVGQLSDSNKRFNNFYVDNSLLKEKLSLLED